MCQKHTIICECVRLSHRDNMQINSSVHRSGRADMLSFRLSIVCVVSLLALPLFREFRFRVKFERKKKCRIKIGSIWPHRPTESRVQWNDPPAAFKTHISIFWLLFTWATATAATNTKFKLTTCAQNELVLHLVCCSSTLFPPRCLFNSQRFFVAGCRYRCC